MSTNQPPQLGPGVQSHRLGALPEPEWVQSLRLAGRILQHSPSEGAELWNGAQAYAVQVGDWINYNSVENRLTWTPGHPLHSGPRHALELNRALDMRKVPKQKPVAPDVGFPVGSAEDRRNR